MSNVFSNVYSFLQQVGSNIILSTTGFIAARKFRAKDSNGLRLEDDGGNLGAFVEDSTANVGIGTASPNASLDVSGSAIFNNGGEDNDFRVESVDSQHMLFVDAGNNRVGINEASPAKDLHIQRTSGETTLRLQSGGSYSDIIQNGVNLFIQNAAGGGNIIFYDDAAERMRIDTDGNVGIGQNNPTAKLEVENSSTSGVAAFKVDNDDTDQVAISVEAANIDANVVDITCADLTESNAIFVQADGLTTGNALNVVSNSDSTAVRALISLKNDHVDATGVTGIALVNDALADGGVGAIFNATMGGNGSVVGLRIKELQVTFPNSGPDAELIVASFFPANCVPIALGIRITTAITGGYITKIGTTSDDDAFGTYADNTLEQVDDNLVAAWSPTQTQGEEGMYFRSTASLKFTTNAVPSGTAGVARIALYHYQITAPTG